MAHEPSAEARTGPAECRELESTPPEKRRNAAPAACPGNPGPQAAGRLLAVRIAGADFDGPFALRSHAFERLLQELEELTAEGERLQASLQTTLYELVPRVTDRDERRQLLALKRTIFAGRPLSAPLPALPAGTARQIRQLEDTRQRTQALFASRRAIVIRELRDALGVLLKTVPFRLACAYASPALDEDVRVTGLPAAEELTSLDRGLYSYASRFISKANPFHLFGEIALCGTETPDAGRFHELVVDAGIILSLERTLLPNVRDSRAVWMSLVPFQRDGTHVRFWAPTAEGYELVSVPDDEPLGAVIAFFDEQHGSTGRPVGTRDQWQTYVASTCHGAAASRVDSRLAELIRRRIVCEYLITDLNTFGPALRHIDVAWDPTVALVERHHLGRRQTEDLPAAHEELARAARETGQSTPGAPVFFVNTYRTIDSGELARAVQPVLADLRDVKPAFTQSHNFWDHAQVLRSYVLDFVDHRHGQPVPYLDLVRHFLRHRKDIIERYHRSHASQDRERQRRAAWRVRLASLEGELSASQLQEFMPETASAGDSNNAGLCFIGPFDFRERRFYVTNALSGNGRYLRRYLLGRTAATDMPPSQPRGLVDVEVVVPPPPNLNYVVPGYPTGCGFEARWAHQYEQWLDPREILVERDGTDVVYRLAGSHTRLSLHYSGFRLAEHLAGEYQLLLLNHADRFDNPFLRNIGSGQNDEVVRVPHLHYGAVCLRRESWSVARQVLAGLLGERDSLRFAYRLRSELRTRCERECELWYYVSPGIGRHWYKPRLLDLRNPLSAHTFRRALERSKPGARISFSEMTPVPYGSLAAGIGPRVSELMMEV